MRTLVIACPDWSIVAAGISSNVPVAVVAANRVVACSLAARHEGVEAGLRRRQAESRCPGLTVIAHDPDRDGRAFEPVLRAAESFTPRLEVLRPGVCAFATRGPSRYFGGDEALAAQVRDRVDRALGTLSADAPRGLVGIADGPFAAERAAVTGIVVAPGRSAAFLAPLPVSSLPNALELAGLLHRLGIRTLGDLSALPPAAVLGRFGPEGATAHRLARGLDDRPLVARNPPPDLDVVAELDPPVDRVEAIAFVAKSLASQLDELLSGQGLVATRVSIEIETDHGERLARLWRHDGGLTAAALAQRARWQVDGWLTGTGTDGPTAGFTLLRLAPDEVAPARGRQTGFWGGERDGDERAARALARVQGMLGSDSVVVAVTDGGREPGDQVRLVTWGDAAPPTERTKAPWPGRIPSPAPATVFPAPMAAQVVDATGEPVTVNGRGHAATEPARVSIAGGPWVDLASWAGPWPVDERWWDASAHRRRARWQVVTAEGSAHLLVVERGRWSVEATYD